MSQDLSAEADQVFGSGNDPYYWEDNQDQAPSVVGASGGGSLANSLKDWLNLGTSTSKDVISAYNSATAKQPKTIAARNAPKKPFNWTPVAIGVGIVAVLLVVLSLARK